VASGAGQRNLLKCRAGAEVYLSVSMPPLLLLLCAPRRPSPSRTPGNPSSPPSSGCPTPQARRCALRTHSLSHCPLAPQAASSLCLPVPPPPPSPLPPARCRSSLLCATNPARVPLIPCSCFCIERGLLVPSRVPALSWCTPDAPWAGRVAGWGWRASWARARSAPRRCASSSPSGCATSPREMQLSCRLVEIEKAPPGPAAPRPLALALLLRPRPAPSHPPPDPPAASPAARRAAAIRSLVVPSRSTPLHQAVMLSLDKCEGAGPPRGPGAGGGSSAPPSHSRPLKTRWVARYPRPVQGL